MNSGSRRRPGLRWALAVVSALGIMVLLASVAAAAPGGLDTSFNGTGKQTLDFGGKDQASHVALTPDGRVVVIGVTDATGGGDYAVARFTAAGAPDSSFNGSGKTTLGTSCPVCPAGVSDIGGGVVVLPDERIVVTGTGNATVDFVTKRLNANGSLDTSFGSAGTSVVNFGKNDLANAMVRQPDGKLVLVGSTDATGGGDFAIARLNADGTPDTSFGSGGKQTIDFGGNDAANGVAIQPDGKIVVLGQGDPSNEMVIARLNTDGSPDTSFGPAGSGGEAAIDFGGPSSGNAVALQADGKIVVAGSTSAVGSGDFAVARLGANGALDPSFSDDGKRTLGYGAAGEQALGVAIQQNGRIVVMGTGHVNHDFVVGRLAPDGSSDTSFGIRGTAGVDFGGDEEDGDVALQPDGKIVLVGDTTVHGTPDFAVARVQGDPMSGGGGSGGGGSGGGGGGGGSGGGGGGSGGGGLGGGGSGGGGGGASGGGGSVTPAVSVSVSTPPGGHAVVLDTSHTTGASTITVAVGGHPEYSGPASLPFLQVTVPGSGIQAQIGVTATGASGVTSMTSVTARIPGTGLPADRMDTRIVAAASPALLTPAPLVSTCTHGSVVEGIIDARGCFVKAPSPSALPAATAAVVARYYKDPVIPSGIIAVCKAELAKTGKTTVCDSLKNSYKAQPIYVSTQTVHLNGLTITPRTGSLIVVYPDQFRVVATNATVTLGAIPLKSGAVDFDLTNADKIRHTAKGGGRGLSNGISRPVLSFDARRGLPNIGGFPLNAGAELAFQVVNGVHESLVTVHVTLPAIFQVFGAGPQPSAAGGAVLSNDDPSLRLDTLDISVPHASIGGLGLDQLAFHYARLGDAAAGCGRDYWHATAQIHLGSGSNGEPGAGFILTPPPIQNGVAFCAGGFKSAGGQINFGFPIPPPQLFPGVLLNEINFAIQLNPTVLRGGATISALDLFKVSGTLLAAFATPRAPYTLTRADAGANLQNLAPRTFTSTTFAVGGKLQLAVPGIGPLDIASGAFLYSYPDYVALSAHEHVSYDIFGFDGSIAGQLNARTRHFEVDLNANICLRGVKIACLGGLGIISSRGVVACLNIGPFHPGVGLRTDLKFEVWLFDGCKPSHYWVRDITTSARSAAAGLSFQLARGETIKNLRLDGHGGAPKVLVTGPGSQSLSLSEDGLTHSGAMLGLRSDQFGATYIGIEHGRPGRYTITPLPGSVPLGPLAATRPGYDSHFTARVTGRGSRLTLHYDARKRGGGQQVSFYEDGKNVMHELGHSGGGHGTLHFTPGAGPRGTRTIVARATVDGSPIQDQVLARFHFAGTPRTGAPRRVTVRRHGGTLLISWSAVAGAVRYGVVVNRSGGAQQQFTLSARRRSLRIPAYPLTEGGQITVSARGPLGDWGTAGKSPRFKATRAAPSMFLSPLRKTRHKHH
ncbi:MAG: delta-60 repeat domain-containing protein [Solirubrobacteraceae bacterium]